MFSLSAARVSVTYNATFQGEGVAFKEKKTTAHRRNNGKQEIVFKQAFGFEIPLAKRCNNIKSSIMISVFGRNICLGESLLGNLRLSSDSGDAAGLKHWDEALQNPYAPITVTHIIHKVMNN